MREPIKFGKYYLFERVAVGGMAEVFKGVSYGVEGFERLFAVKRVLPNISEDQEFIEMFIDEAKIAVQLAHANIGQIFELGNADGAYFIAMEFVQGKDLRAIFDRSRRNDTPLDIAMCCHVVKQVCEALEYAHNRRNERGAPLNLIHRDVSPQNILVSYDGEVKLIDFGIAKAAGKASKTQAGILKGKFGYMSPEQVRGRTIDRRSDLFSLAVVLFELLTLERCFQGESDFSTLEKVRNVDIRRPADLNRAIPPELERIVLRGLSRDPEDRFQSASEFQDALQKFLYQSGSFYARKDLSAYMKGTFGRELESEQARMAGYRDYARQHIREARRATSLPEVEIDVPTDTPFVPDLPALSWEQDEVETSVWDRSPSALTAAPLLGADDRGSDSGFGAGALGAVVAEPALADPPAFAEAARAVGDNGRVRPTTRLPEVDAAALAVANAAPADLRLPAGTIRQTNTSNRLTVLVIIALLAIIGAAAAVWLTGRTSPPSRLIVDSIPAQVTMVLDGERLAEHRTPVTVNDLTAGFHLLRVEAPGHEPVETRISLEEGKAKRIEIRLPVKVGTGLELSTEPDGARVFIDGAEQAQRTPMQVESVKPGKRALKIVKDGYLPWEGTVEAAEGKLRRVETIRLKPDKVSVTFQIEPPDAVVTVILPGGERKTLGAGVSTYAGLPNLGSAVVEVEARGYTPKRTVLPQYRRRTVQEVLILEKAAEVRPKPGRRPARPRPASPDDCEGEDCPPEPGAAPATEAPKRVRIVRRPKPKPKGQGALKVTSRPQALVFVDGKELGWTPILGRKLNVGLHTVELVREAPPQPFRKTFKVEIQRNEEYFLRVTP